MLIAFDAAIASASQSSTAPPSSAIVVTGERTRRSLKETSSSVFVVGRREIDANSADRVDQIFALVPNVQVGSGSQGPSIRGLDTTGALQALPAFLGGNRPRTTLIVDGRRTTYNEFVFGASPLWDVARVELFRSPQTTTQGQNSIAGAIFVTTNDPTFSPESRGRVTVGNFHMRELAGVVSGPLSKDVAVRFAGEVRYQRTTSKIADRVEGGDPNHDVYGIGRVKILIKPRSLPGSRLLVTYSHNQSQAPQIVGLSPPFEERRDVNGLYGTFRVRVDALTAEASQQLTSHVMASMTLTTGRSKARRLALPGLGEADVRGGDRSAEVIASWTPSAPLKVVAGYSAARLQLRQGIDLSRLSGIGRFTDRQTSAGLFGEVTILPIGRVNLTTGLRYQRDRQIRAGALSSGKGPIPLNYDQTFHALLPKATIAYDLNKSIRAGFLVQRSYNPGGTTLRFDTGAPDNFKPETLWDYEFFIRAEASARLRALANIFYYDIHDAQRAKSITVHTSGGLPVGFADLFNAPRAHAYGAESEIAWRAASDLSLRLAAGFLQTKIAQAGHSYLQFDGNEFSRTPHLSVSGSADWQITPRLRLLVNGRHHGQYYSDDMNSTAVTIPAATLFDAQIEYRIGNFKAFAFARNVFNKFALLDRPLTGAATAEDPRLVGIGLETRM